MKQPRSTSYTNTKLSKKPLLPSFRQSKQVSKVQQLAANNKSQMFLNIKILPLQVFADKKTGEMIKITINTNDVVIQDNTKIYRSLLNIPIDIDCSTHRQWLELNFGQSCHNIRVKKIGDQNIFGSSSPMIVWDKTQNNNKNTVTIINVKDIIKQNQKCVDTAIGSSTNQRQDKNKQMKAFVANLMARKVNRRTSQNSQISSRISIKKKSQFLRSKQLITQQNMQYNSIQTRKNHLSTAVSVLSGISGVRSFRKQILDKNCLKDSKFTGKSQKQTSVGDQSLFLNHKTNPIHNQLVSLQSQNYERRKQKFDSQPYFYQKSTVTSQFNNQNQSCQKYQNFSRQETQNKQSLCGIQKQKNVINKTQVLGQCFLNKSEYKSEEQVEQDIKRSQMMNSSIAKNQQQGFSKTKIKVQKPKNVFGQSSQCVQSQQLESEETIYESKYQ